MSDESLVAERAERLAVIGRDLHQRGWVPATSGNFSARIDAGRVLVTASGRHKGELSRKDFLCVDLAGVPISEGKPSAETLLHTQLYAWQPWVDMVLHCHSPYATVLSMVEEDVLSLRGYELIKAFRGHDSHESVLSIPIVENTQHIPDMVGWVAARLESDPMTPAYLIRGHGVYVWGADEAECMRQLEALDFLFHCELQRRRLQG